MSTMITRALVALLAATLTLGGAAAVLAQDAGPAPRGGPHGVHGQMSHPNTMAFGMHRGMSRYGQRMQRFGMNRMGDGPRGRLMRLVCSPRGAERLEIAFVRLRYRLEPTAEQRPLFDALAQSALDEQKKFADACRSARPASDAERADAVERMKGRIAIETARLAALNAVLPKFEAFYDSLTDEQKARLVPQRLRNRDVRNRGPGQRDRSGRPPAAAPAPAQPGESTT